MDSRKLLSGEFREMFDVIEDAVHEEMGGPTVHTGTHPLMGHPLSAISRLSSDLALHYPGILQPQFSLRGVGIDPRLGHS